MVKFSDSDFKKSTHSPHGNLPGRCVSVAISSEGVGIRDTKDPSKTTLVYNRDEWKAFIAGVKDGEFDLTD